MFILIGNYYLKTILNSKKSKNVLIKRIMAETCRTSNSNKILKKDSGVVVFFYSLEVKKSQVKNWHYGINPQLLNELSFFYKIVKIVFQVVAARWKPRLFCFNKFFQEKQEGKTLKKTSPCKRKKRRRRCKKLQLFDTHWMR